MYSRHMLLVFVSMSAVAGCSSGGATQCTTEPRSAWQDEGQFRQNLLDQGYTINEFKVTEGNCYEIYGFDADQTKVEIYFNPVDGSVVKREEG